MVSSMRLGQGKKQIERERVCVKTFIEPPMWPQMDMRVCIRGFTKTAIGKWQLRSKHTHKNHARVHTHCKHLLHSCLSTPHIPYQDNHSCTFKNRNNLTLTIFTLLLSQHTSSNSHNLKRMCIPWKKADR